MMRNIYSKNQIDIATFIGGPFIAIYLIANNFKTFGEKTLYKKTIIWGLVLTLLFFGIIFTIPDNIPSVSIAIIPIIIAHTIVNKYQNNQIEELLKKGFPKASSWKVFAKSILSFIITVFVLILLNQLYTFINVKYNWNNYLNNYCSSVYTESGIQKDKVYVPEDASCFVYSKLRNKGYTLKQVYSILNLEYEYQKNIGIVGNTLKPPEQSSSPYNPVPYILENQTESVLEAQINEILSIEDEYLKLIGALNL
jgi:hypothetical protein